MRPATLAVLLSVVLSGLAGCGHRAAPPTPKAKPAQAVPGPRPSWAPKQPSKEFLRATRLLREMGTSVHAPLEVPGRQDDLAAKAFWRHYERTLMPAWELFGTLDDAQVDQLVSTRRVRLPVKSFTTRQRGLLERYFAVWRQEMKDVPQRETEWSQDWLVELYKAGAREDLSNVLLTYRVMVRGRVSMILFVAKPDGTLSYPLPAGIADLAQSKDRPLSANDGQTTQHREEKQAR